MASFSFMTIFSVLVFLFVCVQSEDGGQNLARGRNTDQIARSTKASLHSNQGDIEDADDWMEIVEELFSGDLDVFHGNPELSVGRVGDIDGDGIEDVGVGATHVNGFRGRVCIVFMNAQGKPDRVNGQLRFSSFGRIKGSILNDVLSPHDNFGFSIEGIGDVNGDGIPDIAVGAIGKDNPVRFGGDVFICFMKRDGTVNSYTTLASGVSSVSSNSFFGSSIANLGDLNGDGVTDLAVGAYNHDRKGAVFIIFLHHSGSVIVSVPIDHTKLPIGNNYNFGISLSRLDDMNQDGVPELAVGSHGEDDEQWGETNVGGVWILYLNRNGEVHRYFRINTSTVKLVLHKNDNFGRSVASIGDLDADGYPDLIVGAPNNDNIQSKNGIVFVLYLVPQGVKKIARFHVIDVTSNNKRIGWGVTSLGRFFSNGRTVIVIATGNSVVFVRLTRGCIGNYYDGEVSPGVCKCAPGMSGENCETCNIPPLTSGIGDGSATSRTVQVKLDATFDKDAQMFHFSVETEYVPRVAVIIGFSPFNRDTKRFPPQFPTNFENGVAVFPNDEHLLINRRLRSTFQSGFWNATIVACNKIIYTLQVPLFDLQKWGDPIDTSLLSGDDNLQRISQRWFLRAVVLYQPEISGPIMILADHPRGVIRLLTVSITSETSAVFQRMGYTSPPYDLGDYEGYLGWSYNTYMAAVPIATANFFQGPFKTIIRGGSALDKPTSQKWTIRLQQTCTVCDGVYIFKHRTTTGQDFVVNNRVFFRYEEPVVGEANFFTSLFLYREDFQLVDANSFYTGERIGILAQVVDLEKVGVTGISVRHAIICHKANANQPCNEVPASNRVNLVRNRAPVTSGESAKFEVKIDGAKPGFEINSAGFSFKGHSINGHRSLVIEVTASVEYSRRLEEIESDNEDIVIHGRLLAPSADSVSEIVFEFQDGNERPQTSGFTNLSDIVSSLPLWMLIVVVAASVSALFMFKVFIDRIRENLQFKGDDENDDDFEGI